MVFVLSFYAISGSFNHTASAAGRVYVELGGGYKAGFEGPHDKKTGKWHVHILKGNKEIATENMDGTKHDGSNLAKAPKSVVKTLKSKSAWDKYKKKQKELEAARADVKKMSLSQLIFNPMPIMVIAAAVGISFYLYTVKQWKSILG